jgi:cell division septal protein FtsQ
MMKFIKNHLESIDGVEIYPIIALLIFFTVFVSMFFYVVKIPKKNIKELSNMPLEGDENINDYE